MKQHAASAQTSLADIIERDIYRGALAPGMWLKQIDLEDRYGCTRLSLRHALEQLQMRKIVQHVPNRGYYVPSVDEAAVQEIMQARAYVETSICEELVANIGDESLARLSYLATLFADSLKAGTVFQQDEANHAFHRELLRSCRNEVMVEIIWDLRLRVPIAVQRANNTPARLERSAREHFEMVEALRLRDAARLREITASHVTYPSEGSR
ncbi:GntR family transcriptional regulator [Rhizobiaceae bacterium BDR2-2]|uniref:GntR family transcriptional regulator n=1 Tax=Ectorhizobium quercum TaxID=2965071 RepID=A0AAE3MZS4_9HYPH|nr:GntR family transcriptional regulator [Ectorhizobium quercum]MCX8997306.1 GntR family transcriptional regulator [Ectorhizobium quercum]